VIDPGLLADFALPLLERLRLLATPGRRPVLLLNAPVGAGKTSLSGLLGQLAPALDLRLAVASIDDFYLPWEQRLQALAGNPFGVTRVPPGSHDPALLCQVLDDWRAGGPLRLPRFDKTLRQGEGDRGAAVSLQADALLLEGWLLGCQPLGEGLQPALDRWARQPANQALQLGAAERAWLPHWDRALEAYQPAWRRCDELWLLRPSDWSLPRRWRFQAEARQRRQGGAALPAVALEQLVRSSLCSLPPPLYQEPLDHQLLQQNGDGVMGGDTSHQHSGPPVVAVALLDGRRRLTQLSASSSLPTG
jgi:D-glycerate 3-kinase